jgi:hypothetical protein
MRPLSTSLTAHEVTRLLGIPAEVVDALVESGAVLCHVRNGETRIPLAQLETFLRDSLIRVYQSERGEAPEWDEQQPPRSESSIAEPEPEPEPEEEAEQQVPLPLPATEVAALAPESWPAEEDKPENRIASRYIPLRQISGIFGDVKFTILQMSATGLRIRHQESVLPGDEAKLSFALYKPARSVVVRARVVWTSIAKAGEERFSISGLRIVEHSERLMRAINDLNAAHELQPERRERSRRETDSLTLLQGVRDEEIAQISAAVQKFANDPVEASRWYSRARFAMSDENVRRAAPQRAREREEVLGIWEYLDRGIDIAKVAGVVTWLRAGEK